MNVPIERPCTASCQSMPMCVLMDHTGSEVPLLSLGARLRPLITYTLRIRGFSVPNALIVLGPRVGLGRLLVSGVPEALGVLSLSLSLVFKPLMR